MAKRRKQIEVVIRHEPRKAKPTGWLTPNREGYRAMSEYHRALREQGKKK